MAMKATSTSALARARVRSARKSSAPFRTPTSTTPSGWSAAISAARRPTVAAIAVSSSRVSGSRASARAVIQPEPSFRETLAHRFAQQCRAQLATERCQLAQLLLEAGPGIGVALAHVGQQHLAEQDGFPLGEVSVHPQVAGLDAAVEEA